MSKEPRLARSDFLRALTISTEHNYEKYVIHVSLARLALDLGDRNEAETRYLEALRSAASEPTTVGVDAVRRLKDLREARGLSSEEARMAHQVVQQAWTLLGIADAPDENDIDSAIGIILKTQAGLAGEEAK